MKKLPISIAFEWDSGNKDKNSRLHNVHDKEAEEVFFNKPIKIYRDRIHSSDETRYSVLGITNHDRKLHVVFSIRNSKIRIISARNQTVKESRLYEKKSK